MFTVKSLLPDHFCRPTSHRYGDLRELRSTANDAIIAAVSNPKHKLRWVPPDRKDDIRSIFMAAVISVAIKAATSRTDQEQSVTTSSGDEEDYVYHLSSSSRSGTGVTGSAGSVHETQSHTRENRAKIETFNYLVDKSKDLLSLSHYHNVSTTYLKYNTNLPS